MIINGVHFIMEENTINVEEQAFNTTGVLHIQLPVFSSKANSGYVMTGLNNLNSNSLI